MEQIGVKIWVCSCVRVTGAAALLATATVLTAEEPTLPSTSVAVALMLTCPSATVVVSQLTVYGEVVTVPSEVALAKNWTWAILIGSATVALTATVPFRLPAGTVSVTTGGASSTAQIDAPVTAIGLVIGAGGKEQRVVWLILGIVAERDAPQARCGNRRAARITDRPDECTGRGVIAIDLAVAEVAYQQRVAERAEIGGSECQAPGRIERTGSDQLLDERAIGVVDVHVAEPRAVGIVVIVRSLLLRVRDVDLGRTAGAVVDRLDAKGCKACRYRGVAECERGRRAGLLGKMCVEHIHLAVMKIGGIQEHAAAVAGNRQSLIDRPAGVGIHRHCVRRIHRRRPAGDHSGFPIKDELGRPRDAAGGHDEIRAAAVEHDARGVEGAGRETHHQWRCVWLRDAVAVVQR